MKTLHLFNPKIPGLKVDDFVDQVTGQRCNGMADENDELAFQEEKSNHQFILEVVRDHMNAVTEVENMIISDPYIRGYNRGREEADCPPGL